MSIFVRNKAPLLITSIIAVLVAANYFFDVSILSDFSSELKVWAVVIAAFAFGLGAIPLLLLHVKRLSGRQEGEWYHSLVVILSFILVLGVGLIEGKGGDNFNWLYGTFLLQLRQCAMALYGFYMVATAYRAFRIRNMDSALLLGGSFIIFLRNMPMSDAIWEGFGTIGSWLFTVPIAAAMRGFAICAALGGTLTCLRVIIGKERGYTVTT
jgi:uncharacterized membrane protein YhaH (DUF805 family)